MIRLHCTALLAGSLMAGGALADDIRIRDNPDQQDFARVTEDMTGAFSYKGLNPAEPLGILGFRADAFVSYTETEHPRNWGDLSGGDFDELAVVGISAGKGLPFGIDVGAFIADVLDTNARLYGAELRYAIVDGGLLTPAVGLRAGYTRMGGVDDIDFSSRSLDLSVSKGFTLLTPYAGIGRVWGRAEANRGGLDNERASENKLYAGLRISLALIKLVVEADNTGDNTTLSLRAGIGL